MGGLDHSALCWENCLGPKLLFSWSPSWCYRPRTSRRPSSSPPISSSSSPRCSPEKVGRDGEQELGDDAVQVQLRVLLHRGQAPGDDYDDQTQAPDDDYDDLTQAPGDDKMMIEPRLLMIKWWSNPGSWWWLWWSSPGSWGNITLEQSKEIFWPVSFHICQTIMWNFWRGTTNYPPPSSLSPSLSMVYWSICILGGSIVPVLKSIVLVERDCANTIVQYSIIVKLSIIVSNHCPC